MGMSEQVGGKGQVMGNGWSTGVSEGQNRRNNHENIIELNQINTAGRVLISFLENYSHWLQVSTNMKTFTWTQVIISLRFWEQSQHILLPKLPNRLIVNIVTSDWHSDTSE